MQEACGLPRSWALTGPTCCGLADFFVSGAVEFGESRVPIDTISARDLSCDR
jgi:hypothetical protein